MINEFFISDKPGKPDRPEITRVARTSITLAYKPPESDGGSAIFNYAIEYRVEGGYKWVRANEDEVTKNLTYIVKGLKAGSMYEFRVAAENRAGVGPMSDPTEPREAKDELSKFAP